MRVNNCRHGRGARLALGEAALPGVHGPEAVIPPALMFARLRESGFVTRMKRTQVL